MPDISPTILAVDPGTRELGVAVLGGKELLFYGVKTVSNRKNPLVILETISDYIRGLISKYCPTHLSIEKMFVTQKNSSLLVVAAEQVKAIGEASKLPVYEYAPSTVRKRLCQTGRATKRETAEVLASRFPELKCYYRRTAAWELDYYGNLFDAVAVGVVCGEDLAQSEVSKQQTSNV